MTRPSKPRLLDLFCGAGGAAMGYHRAGFDVVGVDHVPQPNYPFEFLLGNAATFDRWVELGPFDAIHASPPCQRWAQGQHWHDTDHPDLITPLRPLLDATGLPYVIENVPGAPLRRDLILCGTQFELEADGFEVRRHRVFELNWDFGALVPPCQHRLPTMPVFGHNANADFYRRHGKGVTIDARRRAMEVDWTTRDELAEAIPPAFTTFIARQLAKHLAPFVDWISVRVVL